MDDWAMRINNKVQVSTVSYSHRIENEVNYPGRLACGCYNEQSSLQGYITSILEHKKIYDVDRLGLGHISGLGWDFHLGSFKIYWLIQKGDKDDVAKKLGISHLVEKDEQYNDFFIVSLTYKESSLIEKKLYLYHKNIPSYVSRYVHPKSLLSVTAMLSSTRGRVLQADVREDRSIFLGDNFYNSAQSVISLYADQDISLDTVSWNEKGSVTLYF